MPIIAAGASQTITIDLGLSIVGNGVGTAVVGPGPRAGQQFGLVGIGWRVGPFPGVQVVYVTATGEIGYETDEAGAAELVGGIAATTLESVIAAFPNRGAAEAQEIVLGPDNFGVNWIRTPVDFASSSGTNPAVRRDQTGVYAGTESAGWVRVYVPFSTMAGGIAGLFTDASATMVENRLLDLQYIVRFWHSRGKKILFFTDGVVVPGATATELYRDRLTVLLRRLATVPFEDGMTASDVAEATLFMDAFECANEPYGPLVANFGIDNFVSQALPKMAEIMRVTYTLFRAYSPKTIVCTPCWQGGEVGAVEAMLAASAAGVAVRGDSGTGTRGEQWCDVITYHPYPIVDTITAANAALASPDLERGVRQYSTFIQTAVANRRLAPDGGSAFWAGRPDPEYWCTEVNVTGQGANITSNTKFRMQPYTPEQRYELLRKQVLGALASGYSKVFPYAVDHGGDIGPWIPSGFTTGANGDLRITADTAPVFDGDLVYLQGGTMPYPMTGIAYNATADGLAYDVRGVPAGLAPNLSIVKRSLLGGWHLEWARMQKSLEGKAITGFDGASPATAVPFIQSNLANQG